jgi:hypothetical protein
MRRHDFDGLSLAFGLLFSVVGLLLISGVKLSDRLIGPWVGPAILIALAAIIVISVRPSSRDSDEDAGEPGQPGDAAGSPAG